MTQKELKKMYDYLISVGYTSAQAKKEIAKYNVTREMQLCTF